MKLNLDYLLEMLWEYLALTCIYTKKRGRESSSMQPKKQLSLTLPQGLPCYACGPLRGVGEDGSRVGMQWGRVPYWLQQ